MSLVKEAVQLADKVVNENYQKLVDNELMMSNDKEDNRNYNSENSCDIKESLDTDTGWNVVKRHKYHNRSENHHGHHSAKDSHGRTIMASSNWHNDHSKSLKQNNGVFHNKEYYHLSSCQVAFTKFKVGDRVIVQIPSFVYVNCEGSEDDRGTSTPLMGKVISIDSYSVGKEEKARMVHQYDIDLDASVGIMCLEPYTDIGRILQMDRRNSEDGNVSSEFFVVGLHESQLQAIED